MTRKRVIGWVAMLGGLVSAVAVLYGVSKVSLAEEVRPVPVKVDLPGVSAGTPPDAEMRALGVRALAIGFVGLFASAVAAVVSLRDRPNAGEMAVGERGSGQPR